MKTGCGAWKLNRNQCLDLDVKVTSSSPVFTVCDQKSAPEFLRWFSQISNLVSLCHSKRGGMEVEFKAMLDDLDVLEKSLSDPATIHKVFVLLLRISFH
ncbi:hypothetical protein F2Q68_00042762 [Brassica cretica]|uniref:Uncharacterized protein n=1 Tax=Brassica cretica TaxID=69181 RepID=A0A8S9MLC2_BRACR|nr:hypothetical protein F2Q68_00042762 [Brassica cretica]